MGKNFIILVLFVLSVISLTSLKSMSSRASYWMQRTIAAEAVIERCAEGCVAYFLDVFMEVDEYNDWITLESNL